MAGGLSQGTSFAKLLFFMSIAFPILQHLRELIRLPVSLYFTERCYTATERARRSKHLMKTMRKESERILETAKSAALDDEPDLGKDLLSLLVKANVQADNEKTRLSDQEIMGQVSFAATPCPSS